LGFFTRHRPANETGLTYLINGKANRNPSTPNNRSATDNGHTGKPRLLHRQLSAYRTTIRQTQLKRHHLRMGLQQDRTRWEFSARPPTAAVIRCIFTPIATSRTGSFGSSATRLLIVRGLNMNVRKQRKIGSRVDVK
jgi:hypothetical protein